jgi:hypothetical protein
MIKYLSFFFICNFYIFPLISLSDNVSMMNWPWYSDELTMILKFIGHCAIKHIMMIPIKTITSVLKVSIYIIIAHPIRLSVKLVIMSVSTFKTAVILYMYLSSVKWHITNKTSVTQYNSTIISNHCMFMYRYKVHQIIHNNMPKKILVSAYILEKNRIVR